jgi:hypothetical protein
MVAVTDKFRKVAAANNRAVATGLQNAMLPTDTSVVLSAVTGWVDGSISAVDLVIYRKNPLTGLPDSSTQTDWTGMRSGNTVSFGTNIPKAGTMPTAGYPADSNTVVFCTPTAAWANELIDGLLASHNPDGSLLAAAVRTALGITSNVSGGWDVLNSGVAPTVASGANKGNKEVELTYANVNLSTVLSPGMKHKVDRAVAAPTQSMVYSSVSSQYATKATPSNIAFTSAFTCEAWIYLNSYTGQIQGIVGRTDNTTGGFRFGLDSNGRPFVDYAAASAYTQFITIQSLPLNKWTHVAAVVTSVSGKTGAIYINGIAVPIATSLNAAATLTQTGNLSIGAFSTGAANTFLNAAVSEVRVWGVAQTLTQILDNMAISLVGSETNLVGLWQGNGNFTDKTANGNSLTSTGGATATTVTNPYNNTEYGFITKVVYSNPNTVVSVFTGTDCNIPNATLASPYSSYQRSPYNFPAGRGKWTLRTAIRYALGGINFLGTGVWTDYSAYLFLRVPTGAWKLSFAGDFAQNNSAGASVDNILGIDSVMPALPALLPAITGRLYLQSAVTYHSAHLYSAGEVNLTTSTTYGLFAELFTGGGTVQLSMRGDRSVVEIVAECAYA